MRTLLTQERLKELLRYDPETGVFTWRVQVANRYPIGHVVGCSDKDGYLRVRIAGKDYKLHRLAFFYMAGEWPKLQVDHRDGCKSNNKWANLRDVSAGANQQNRRVAQVGASAGLLGVHQHAGRSMFSARISLGGKRHQLGTFKTAVEAHEAYLTAKRSLHEGCTI